eukprot:TRINITY_DN10750_c0_g1_i1.p1 TRINITY_DN10750_c0_g1~~TRINITY_DN10750_c0_g1_i1.p1  ORF type:complete len:486 (+),score=161.61 TRINITY_DN10750_c0_g1_i1:150-1607(+)
MDRAAKIVAHVGSSSSVVATPTSGESQEKKNPSREVLSVTDERTGKKIEIPIKDGAIRATDLKKLGLKSYDPGYFNTASAISRITYIDGDRGILEYRGYPIEELCEKSSFLEVAFLLLNGNLPNKAQLDQWTNKIMTHTYLHENLTGLMKNFRYDAHPMGMVISTMAALSTFYPEANAALSGQKIYQDPTIRNKQIYRIIGKLPTIAACAYRHRIGRPYNQPVNHLSYVGNFLYMLDHLSETKYRPNPKLEKALDVLFIIHADHEMNCGTAAMRHISSSLADPYTAVAGAAGALYGPLHGGANEAVLRMLEEIGTVDNIPEFLAGVKNKTRKLMGFGHRIYKNYDPRAKIICRIAHEVFDELGREPLIEVATELERIALSDEYFVSRKLYPNVDFYSGLIYRAMGFPTDMFPVLFTIPRAVGYLAHWSEQLDDPENKIARPLQIYKGHERRPYVPLEERHEAEFPTKATYSTIYNKRRNAGLSKY